MKLYKKKYDICIVGGAGHIGLPLALSFASKKNNVLLYDINVPQLETIKKKKMPFYEKGGNKFLRKYYKYLNFSNNIEDIKYSKNIIICIGTPVNKNNIPETKKFLSFFKVNKKLFSIDQNIIIRSSVYPGVCEKIYEIFEKKISISYCPERIVQSLALVELPKLTQIISGFSKRAISNAVFLFKKICNGVILTSVKEAEFIKLFSNAYRYVNFSIANQFYLMCENQGLKYSRVNYLMKEGYYRNLNIPMSGFTAGPCLLKDTIQLSHYFKHKFGLGLSSMQINENFPIEIFKNIESQYNLKKHKIGLLGLTFKADVDDLRDSLAIKLYNYLKKRKIEFYVNDLFFEDYDNFLSLNNFIKKCDIIIIASPHKKYKKLKFTRKTKVIDCWNFYESK